ncbi:4-oxalocrotonate tautomerase family protein [Paucibacter sp. B2R-40]|uniref:tautomerase family protein n=1 Tax=Paucibacter sp. B2R-40 TaxID=2893554 RepID=UPI0021E4B4A4|nr:4-oxalocrotonate tautomerase family protein [Paucibacter sp. B2R-40]MCV2353476.1 4-oxalocrotonate tautomerase family protein [Paucibacter sp. B2R-40]
MPYLHLSLSPAPGTDPSLRDLAATLTELTAEHLAKVPALTAVRIELVPATHWFIGARPLAADTLASYQLQIQVTAGTNTAAQISAYLAAVHTAMGVVLGRLHPTSYIVVQQVPADAWGYGGQSQAQRKAAAALA